MLLLSITMAAAGTSEGSSSGDITSSFIVQDSAKIFLKDSLENSADADISQSTESHTAEIFLASVGLQPSSRDQKELQESPKQLESTPMAQSNFALPPGWKKIYIQRMAGKTAGKYDAYIFSPDGRKHRSKTDLLAYLEKKNLSGQYDINDFDFTVRNVHVTDGADGSTSSTPVSQTKTERKRSKSLTPKQVRMSEPSGKKSKKHKAVEASPEISLNSSKSKKRKSEPSSTPSVSSSKVKKFKTTKAESEKSEASHFRKKSKSLPKLKLPMKKLKIKLKFSIPAKREKVSLDNTTVKVNESIVPDSFRIESIDNEPQEKKSRDAISDVSGIDLFDRSLNDTSMELSEKELQDRSQNDGSSSERDRKERHRRSMAASRDIEENELRHNSPGGAADEIIKNETNERSRNEAVKNELSCNKNSLPSRASDESSCSRFSDYETPHISETPLQSKRYRRESESDLSDGGAYDGNDKGNETTSKFSSSSYSKIISVAKTNNGSKTECNNNSPRHMESDSEPLHMEDVCVSWLDHCNRIEQRLQQDHDFANKQWFPPQSPYNLIEEQLDNDPWKVLVVSIFIESGEGCFEAGSLPRRSVKEFFKLCPSPKRVKNYGRKRILRSLGEYGISEGTVNRISKFSDEYLSNPGDDPSSLHGIGRYGQDAYRIFCINEWKKVVPENRKLKDYHRWLWLNHRVFCKN